MGTHYESVFGSWNELSGWDKVVTHPLTKWGKWHTPSNPDAPSFLPAQHASPAAQARLASAENCFPLRFFEAELTLRWIRFSSICIRKNYPCRPDFSKYLTPPSPSRHLLPQFLLILKGKSLTGGCCSISSALPCHNLILFMDWHLIEWGFLSHSNNWNHWGHRMTHV